jgi:hypothetical protein
MPLAPSRSVIVEVVDAVPVNAGSSTQVPGMSFWIAAMSMPPPSTGISTVWPVRLSVIVTELVTGGSSFG